MRSEDLYSAIGNMDDRYIDDRPIGEVKKSKRLPLWSKLVAVAACIALVFAGVTAGKQGTADIGALVYDRDGCYHAASSYNENGGGTYRLTEQPVRSLRSLRRQMQKKHRTMREDEYEMHKNMTDIVYGWY